MSESNTTIIISRNVPLESPLSLVVLVTWDRKVEEEFLLERSSLIDDFIKVDIRIENSTTPDADFREEDKAGVILTLEQWITLGEIIQGMVDELRLKVKAIQT